ncbi:beta-glucosidase [Parafrankia soli]|uniref:Beta-glucosidase n=1 Tax=Parafrankia soli TaxID=2599596 RepID=A0A1S1QQY8_9ACTN|nr:GH1 family beta-glucosidase [Parafrankia soli]OHV35512.1 beta-glucosidase [Parafrankia soli]
MTTSPVPATDTTAATGVPAPEASPGADELAARIATGLPTGFVWGAATSAYQIEGGAREGGRGPSIWDVFARTPGMTSNGENGDVAADHLHRYREDVALMAGLGLGAYRFSVAWPRIVPAGSGAVNPDGLAFYDRLVDELLAAGIDPWLTLYHWDLPQPLQDAGGWPNRDTALRFADYTEHVVSALGDRVRHWSTLNEPWCSAFEGHLTGRHAPGVRDAGAAVRAVHHLLLAHGLGTAVLRAHGAADVGITLNLIPAEPSPDTAGAGDTRGGDTGAGDAVRLVDGQQIRLWLDPVLHGTYPSDVIADFARAGAELPAQDGDLAVIAQPVDWIGVNYYAPHIVAPGPDPSPKPTPFAGAGNVTRVPTNEDVTALGWPVRPRSFLALLRRLGADYPGVPFYIHENGAAYDDEVSPDGTVHDPLRVRYLAGHLDAVRQASEDGVDVRGYFVWSLLDNFEWAEGYRMRFGIVHVDFESLVRTPKSSGLWYSRLIREHRAASGTR